LELSDRPHPLGVGIARLDGRPEKEALRLRDISTVRYIEEVPEVRESNSEGTIAA
jgi:hypothetical protein